MDDAKAAFCDGILLAASACGDHDAARAALCPDLRDAIRKQVAAEETTRRDALLRRADARRLRLRDTNTLTPRERAVLANDPPLELGRSSAPRGPRIDPGVKQALLANAAASDRDESDEHDELVRGRDEVARGLGALDDEERAVATAALDEGELSALLALARLVPVSDGRWTKLALRIAPAALIRTAGALSFGADGKGSRSSALRRVGREIAELGAEGPWRAS